MSKHVNQTESFGAITDTAEHAGGQMILDQFPEYSATVVWSAGAAPVGTFKLQMTDAPEPEVGDWVDLSPTMAISGNAGNAALSGRGGHKWIRPHIELASGDATFVVHMTAKEG